MQRDLKTIVLKDCLHNILIPCLLKYENQSYKEKYFYLSILEFTEKFEEYIMLIKEMNISAVLIETIVFEAEKVFDDFSLNIDSKFKGNTLLLKKFEMFFLLLKLYLFDLLSSYTLKATLNEKNDNKTKRESSSAAMKRVEKQFEKTFNKLSVLYNCYDLPNSNQENDSELVSDELIENLKKFSNHINVVIRSSLIYGQDSFCLFNKVLLSQSFISLNNIEFYISFFSKLEDSFIYEEILKNLNTRKKELTISSSITTKTETNPSFKKPNPRNRRSSSIDNLEKNTTIDNYFKPSNKLEGSNNNTVQNSNFEYKNLETQCSSKFNNNLASKSRRLSNNSISCKKIKHSVIINNEINFQVIRSTSSKINLGNLSNTEAYNYENKNMINKENLNSNNQLNYFNYSFFKNKESQSKEVGYNNLKQLRKESFTSKLDLGISSYSSYPNYNTNSNHSLSHSFSFKNTNNSNYQHLYGSDFLNVHNSNANNKYSSVVNGSRTNSYSNKYPPNSMTGKDDRTLDYLSPFFTKKIPDSLNEKSNLTCHSFRLDDIDSSNISVKGNNENSNFIQIKKTSSKGGINSMFANKKQSFNFPLMNDKITKKLKGSNKKKKTEMEIDSYFSRIEEKNKEDNSNITNSKEISYISSFFNNSQQEKNYLTPLPNCNQNKKNFISTNDNSVFSESTGNDTAKNNSSCGRNDNRLNQFKLNGMSFYNNDLKKSMNFTNEDLLLFNSNNENVNEEEAKDKSLLGKKKQKSVTKNSKTKKDQENKEVKEKGNKFNNKTKELEIKEDKESDLNNKENQYNIQSPIKQVKSIPAKRKNSLSLCEIPSRKTSIGQGLFDEEDDDEILAQKTPVMLEKQNSFYQLENQRNNTGNEDTRKNLLRIFQQLN